MARQGRAQHRGRQSHRTRRESPKGDLLFGRQPVLECLAAGRRACHRIHVSVKGHPTPEVSRVLRHAEALRIPVVEAESRMLDGLAQGGNHQGLVAEVDAYPYVTLEALMTRLRDAGTRAFLLFLDHIQDPQNLGAILRTGDAAGVTGVVIPRDRACGVTAAAVRASAGASEHVQVACVVNLVRAMEACKAKGIWLYGLDAGTEARPYDAEDLTGPVGLVIGNEGSGMGRLVGQTCDVRIRLPMAGNVASLNASVSAAIAVYEVLRQRRSAATPQA